jgi:hypothetical protein
LAAARDDKSRQPGFNKSLHYHASLGRMQKAPPFPVVWGKAGRIIKARRKIMGAPVEWDYNESL